MAQPRILILRAPGTNCDAETTHAFELAGARTERLHVNQILENPKCLSDFQVLCVAGGFSYGDDLGAGRILGNQMQHHLSDTLESFRHAGKLILGICNGMQILLKTNLLAPADKDGPTATLTLNDSGQFEARWVRLESTPGRCVFLQGIERIELPVAHAEGKFVPRDEEVMRRLDEHGQLVLRYGKISAAQSAESELRSISSTSDVTYPDNPNGAVGNIAGICDASGQVLGLMPHPERYVDATQHPRWTRQSQGAAGDGLRIFQNAVRYFR